MSDYLNLVLFEPEIPQNTGNLIRLAANMGATLHLIHPLGFELGEKAVRRSGLDYHALACVVEHQNFPAFLRQQEPASLYAGTWPRFRATVVNTGTGHALTLPDGVGFRVELYIKTSPSDPPGWPSDHDWGYCLDSCTVTRYQYLADVGQLLAGESVDVWFEALDLDPSPDFPGEGSYDIYAQVDVAFGNDSVYWGRYLETDEENNIWHGTMDLAIFVPDNFSYLPLIFRFAP